MKQLDQLADLMREKGLGRQQFLQLAGRTIAVGVVGGIGASCRTSQSSTRSQSTFYTSPDGVKVSSSSWETPPAKVPDKADEPIQLEEWKAKTEQESETPAPMLDDQRVGYAIVGLGHLSLDEILPAFGESKTSKVVALVSGSPEKMQKVAKQYGVKPENCYSYQNYDRLRDNKEVQVIYIVLPNSMHAEYTIRGAQAGKHILCEKPMATSAADCQAMIDACKKADRKLMVAYRIQYEPNNRMIRQLVQDKKFGTVKFIEAVNAQNSANPQHWRHIKALAGGGALPDIGLYCLNTVRYLLGEEPTEVFAWQYSTPGDARFREVEEFVSWQMKFPSGIYASCSTHYGVHESRRYRVHAERGWMEAAPAFSYNGIRVQTSHAEGKIEHTDQPKLAEKNQFATEMDHFSECILQNKQPFTPGEEGLQDQRIMEAIYQSAREGKPVKLTEIKQKDAFRGPRPKEG
ncbi:Gfo/Idh/MocA family oxidoreductase [Larkinella knui]|uniref:Gfo/Idh/MocA family oxidoreductase n=1 Tax=Larkinella knui TaxID=2025310 RepID=A0A3P1CYF6_9BACT|nr:Gfo/Idh/MocA family oxidoreductase [Larkinella knui]RRB18365.1 gfo/Idh/MocA family oxidoreductase [Larkinella knui]